MWNLSEYSFLSPVLLHMIIFLHLWLKQNQCGLRCCLFASFPSVLKCVLSGWEKIFLSSTPLTHCIHKAFEISSCEFWQSETYFVLDINQTCFLTQYHSQAHTNTLEVTHANPLREKQRDATQARVCLNVALARIFAAPESWAGWRVVSRRQRSFAAGCEQSALCFMLSFSFSFFCLLPFYFI